jgi:hypothetical protein
VPNIERPAVVRPAEDADAAYVRSEIAAGHKANEQRLIHWLNAGRRLLEKKRQLASRTGTRPLGWKKWLVATKETQPTADRYVRYAEDVEGNFGKAAFPKAEELEPAWERSRNAPRAEPADEPVADAEAEVARAHTLTVAGGKPGGPRLAEGTQRTRQGRTKERKATTTPAAVMETRYVVYVLQDERIEFLARVARVAGRFDIVPVLSDRYMTLVFNAMLRHCDREE